MSFGALGRGSRDMIDQEVQSICRLCPAVLEGNTIARRSHGRYTINGRDVLIQVVTAEGLCEDEEDAADNDGTTSSKSSEDGGSSTRASSDAHVSIAIGDEAHCGLGLHADSVVVRDGPLRQPFLDYVFNTGMKEQYDVPASEKTLQDSKLTGDDCVDVEIEYGEIPYDPADRSAAMSVARIEVQMRQARRVQRSASQQQRCAAPAELEPLVDDSVMPERAALREAAPSAGRRRRCARDTGLVTSGGMKAMLAQLRAKQTQDYEEQMAQALLKARQRPEGRQSPAEKIPQAGAAAPAAAHAEDAPPGAVALAACKPHLPEMPPQLPAPAAPAAEVAEALAAAPASRHRRRRLFGEVILPGAKDLPPFAEEERLSPRGTRGAADDASSVCQTAKPSHRVTRSTADDGSLVALQQDVAGISEADLLV